MTKATNFIKISEELGHLRERLSSLEKNKANTIELNEVRAKILWLETRMDTTYVFNE